ncbi:MAG: 6-pyruvoyl tetrahydropterin synthase family protein [Bacteroides sp.]
MARIRVTKEFHFEAAHFLPGYDGLCANLHGHSYRLLVTLRGEILKDATSPKNGMVIDFSVLKGIVERNILQVLDHSLIVRKHTYDLPATCTHFRILELDDQPTSENILLWIVERLHSALPQQVELFRVGLYETATSCAEWTVEDNA